MSRLARASWRLYLEALEDRTLMSVCHVTRVTDQGIGKRFRELQAMETPSAITFLKTGIDLFRTSIDEDLKVTLFRSAVRQAR